MTSQLQPLDTAINSPFKDWLRQAAIDYTFQREQEGKTEWSVRDKQVMTTFIVAAAAKRLAERIDLVERAFIQCGISVRPDGSQDNEIRIKDVPREAVDFSGWED